VGFTIITSGCEFSVHAGTILSCAAGVMAARGEDKLQTLTLLTTMLDFTDIGDI
jgi:poly(3-hydroxyalkanoate) synthetase